MGKPVGAADPAAPMVTLRMLGGVSLMDADGNEIDVLLRQPKHMALLAYLAMPKPGTWHRRDAIVAAFWPDLDQSRARTALRSALHKLRKNLPVNVVRSRGDDEVCIDPVLVSTDVAALEDNVSANRLADALACYAGELLPSIHIPEADDFEKWLTVQRSRVRSQALMAARLLTESRADAGDVRGAIDAARRASEIDSDDETAVQRLIALLDRAGDRSQAFAVYEQFRHHVADAFGVRPSAETVAIVDAVRTRRDASADISSSLAHAEASPAEATNAGPFLNPHLVDPVSGKSKSARARLVGVGAAVLIVLAIAALAPSLGSRSPQGPAPAAVKNLSTAGRRLVVLPMQLETGSGADAYIAAGLAEGIGRRLEGMGGLSVLSGARSDWPESARRNLSTLSRTLGSKLFLRTKLTRSGDEYEVHASLFDLDERGERRVASRRFGMDMILNAESEIAAAVAGELFRSQIPSVPRGRAEGIDPKSYSLMLEGWHHLMTGRRTELARGLFQEATALDPKNSRAWSGLSSAWAIDASSERIPFDEAYDRASAAADHALALDSMDGTALANLGLLRALRQRSVSTGAQLIQKAITYDPGNPEIYVIQSHLYRSAWDWAKARDAIRVARRLDPLNPYHVDREATIELCAGQAASALRVLESELATNPSNRVATEGKVRALVRLERYDEAIVLWKALAASAGDTSIAKALEQSRGKQGYWSARWFQGRKRLNELKQSGAGRETTPAQLLRAQFEAGEIEAGYRTLDVLIREKSVRLYRLPCLPAMDFVRGSPRFDAVLKKFGAMPAG